MKLLIVDTETNGIDDDSQCLEVGALLYDVGTKTVLSQVSTLLPVDANPSVAINKISAEATQQTDQSTVSIALHLIDTMDSVADFVVAHSADFDKKFLNFDKQWLCTYEDFRLDPFPPQSLINLAVLHGVSIKTAHRALADCQLLADIFTAREDLEQLIFNAEIRAKSPKIWIRAKVSFAEKDLAKTLKFQPHYVEGKFIDWRKEIKECDLDNITIPYERI